MRVAIAVLALVAFVSGEPAPKLTAEDRKYLPGVPPPSLVDFEGKVDPGWSVKITPPARAGKSFKSKKGFRDGQFGAAIQVVRPGSNTSYVELRSPWWRFQVGKRYQFKIPVKSMPRAAPGTVSLQRRLGCCDSKTVNTKDVIFNATWGSVTVAYTNFKPADYKLVIGVGAQNGFYSVDSIVINELDPTLPTQKVSDNPTVSLGI